MVDVGIKNRVDMVNEDKIRFLIMEEIVVSEKKFIEAIEYLCSTIKSDLTVCSNQLEYEISECHIRTLLSNIDEVLAVHQKFFELLSEVIHIDKEDAKAKIGECFNTMEGHFKVYETYIANFMKTQITLGEVKSMATMQPIYEKWKATSILPPVKYNGKSILEVYLKEPLFRLCRYVVFLKELSAFTGTEHVDYHNVLKAHYTLQKTAGALGKVLRTDLYTMAYEECNKESEIWENLGLTCKEGFLTKRGGNVKSWKIRYFTLKMYDFRYYDEPADDKALNCLDLKQCTSVVVNAENMQRPHCFGLVLPDRTYNMYCTNEADKMSWLCAIAWRLFCLVPSHMKAGRTLAQSDVNSTPIDLLMVNENTSSTHSSPQANRS